LDFYLASMQHWRLYHAYRNLDLYLGSMQHWRLYHAYRNLDLYLGCMQHWSRTRFWLQSGRGFNASYY